MVGVGLHPTQLSWTSIFKSLEIHSPILSFYHLSFPRWEG